MTITPVAWAGPQPCEPPAGWRAALEAAKDGVLVIGETHGTQEAPRALGEYACAASHEGSVLVALEYPKIEDAALQSALAGEAVVFRQTLLDTMPFSFGSQDGRASEAMLSLLVRLKVLRDAGRPINIAAFNSSGIYPDAVADLPGQEPYEATQALNILEAIERHKPDHVVVLVGNLHAMKAPTPDFGAVASFRPMAVFLGAETPVTSLNVSASGGTAWACRGASLGCGVSHPFGQHMGQPLPMRTEAHRSKGQIHLYSTDGSTARAPFDGVLDVGWVTASEPVMPQKPLAQ